MTYSSHEVWDRARREAHDQQVAAQNARIDAFQRFYNFPTREEAAQRAQTECGRTWGACPDADDGDPHWCMWTPGHHSPHACGTCDADLPLDGAELSALDWPLRSV